MPKFYDTIFELFPKIKQYKRLCAAIGLSLASLMGLIGSLNKHLTIIEKYTDIYLVFVLLILLLLFVICLFFWQQDRLEIQELKNEKLKEKVRQLESEIAPEISQDNISDVLKKMEQTIDIEVWPPVYLGTYDDIDYRTKYKHISRTIVKYFQEIANITYKCKATKNDIINKIYYMREECENGTIVIHVFKVGHPFKTVDELITLLLSYDLLKVIEMQESEQHKYILTPLGEVVYEKIRL